MRTILSERNIIIALFIMVLVTFSLAQEDTKKMERGFSSANAFKSPHLLLAQKADIPASIITE